MVCFSFHILLCADLSTFFHPGRDNKGIYGRAFQLTYNHYRETKCPDGLSHWWTQEGSEVQVGDFRIM